MEIKSLILNDRLIVASARPRITNHPWKGRGEVTQTIKILVGTNHKTAEAIVVKFCTQIGYIKSQHTDKKWNLKGAWSWSRDPLTILGPQWYLWNGLS